MRALHPEGLALIKHFESFAATPYLCPAGYETIGYGHVVRKGERLDIPLTLDAAHRLLVRDVALAQQAVERLITADLTEGQYAALVSFTFNLGAGALQRSALRRKVNAARHNEVGDELRRWVFAGGRRLRGLVRRREAEAALYASKL